MRGSMLRKANKHKLAKRALAEAAKSQPGSAGILRNQGDSKMQLRNFAGAVEDLERANALQPDQAFTLRSLGIAKGRLPE